MYTKDHVDVDNMFTFSETNKKWNDFTNNNMRIWINIKGRINDCISHVSAMHMYIVVVYNMNLDDQCVWNCFQACVLHYTEYHLFQCAKSFMTNIRIVWDVTRSGDVINSFVIINRKYVNREFPCRIKKVICIYEL